MNPRRAPVVRVAPLGADVGRRSSARSRSNAATSSASSSTRITPRLPDSASGLTTHGKRDRSAELPRDRRRCGTVDEPRDRQTGVAQPFALSAACCARPSPRPADGPGRPSPSRTRAAITVGRSPTARTPSIGLVRAPRSMIVAVDSDSSWNRIGIARSLPGIVEHVAAIGREDADRRRAARPPRRTRASGIRSWSRAAELCAFGLASDRLASA